MNYWQVTRRYVKKISSYLLIELCNDDFKGTKTLSISIIISILPSEALVLTDHRYRNSKQLLSHY